MSSGLGQLNAYIVVNADDIAVYDYEEIMSGNFPNYRRKTNEKGFEIATNAKNIQPKIIFAFLDFFLFSSSMALSFRCFYYII